MIATAAAPVNAATGLAVLKGNICPDGAVIKPSAASAHLMRHTGPALVFESIDDYKARINDDDLEVDANTVLVLKNVGPKGYPGMPEVGNMTLPKKLLQQGISDMVRISDGRMSGTGFGTVILHVSPEAALGGNFSVLQTGDMISLDVERRTLDVQLTDEELARRRKAWQPPSPQVSRGYVQLYTQRVLQAHLGADLDF
ncbi:hypothetical protein [Niabella agricola]